MNDIFRLIEGRITAYLKPGKAVLVFGARRTGKTVLIGQILKKFPGRTLLLNGEDQDTHALLEARTAANYRRLLEGVDVFALDEAQNVPDIGLKLKLITDEVPHVRIIASGSSSLDLLNKAGEPLVGRSARFLLTPFSVKETAPYESPLETRRNLETRLVYGSYPETVLMEKDREREEYLREMVNAYLLKDILSLEGLRNSSRMQKLLYLISFQAGKEVSCVELGNLLGLSKNTVEKYLDLLSQVFVIYRLGAYSRNLRKEVAKTAKWNFWDNGILNAVKGNFNPLSVREDTGALWENYCAAERIKNCNNEGISAEHYFWRTYDQQEIDLVEAGPGGTLSAFEFKWGGKIPRVPVAFAKAYPEAGFEVINRDNYLDLI
jgi:predicted AAA+ superfamily ATPase